MSINTKGKETMGSRRMSLHLPKICSFSTLKCIQFSCTSFWSPCQLEILIGKSHFSVVYSEYSRIRLSNSDCSLTWSCKNLNKNLNAFRRGKGTDIGKMLRHTTKPRSFYPYGSRQLDKFIDLVCHFPAFIIEKTVISWDQWLLEPLYHKVNIT